MEASELKRIAEECRAAGLSHEETIIYSQTAMNTGISPRDWVDSQNGKTVEDYVKIMNGDEGPQIGKVDLFA